MLRLPYSPQIGQRGKELCGIRAGLHRFLCTQTRNGQFIPELIMAIYIKHLKSYIENEFCFIHIQLAMRRYHYGPQFGIHPSVLYFTGVTVRNTSTALHSFEAQICIDLRSQFYAYGSRTSCQ